MTNAVNVSSLGSAMVADSSGNVGIGTASPSVYSNQTTLTVNGTTYGRVDLANGGTVRGYLYGGSGGVTLETGGALPVAFATNATERMRITSAGYVTTSYQPRFHAICNGTTTLSGSTLLFQTVILNTSSSYNSSTSTFTAPITGSYFIYGSVMANSGTGRLYWRLYKNGSFYQVLQAGGDSTNYGEWYGSATIPLAAGDYLNLILGTGTPYSSNNQEQYFGGWLLG